MNNFSLPSIDNFCKSFIRMGYIGLLLAIELDSLKKQAKTKIKLSKKVIYLNINSIKKGSKKIYNLKIISKGLEIEDFSTTLFGVEHDYFKNMIKNPFNNIKNKLKIIFYIDDIVTRNLNPVRL